MRLGSEHACILAAGLALAASAMLLTHPVAVALNLALAVALGLALDLHREGRAIAIAAGTIGLAVVAFNGLFAWRGATTLWEAPFRLTLLGRPRLTLEALAWGAVAGAQLAATVLAFGAATVAVPPEALNRAMERAGVPAQIAHAAGLALRLVPDTARDARAMRDALRVRGVDTGTVRGASQTLVPLAARSLDRAMVAEEALLTRGFDPEASEVRWPPAGLLSLAGALVAGLVAFLGPGRPDYYPTIGVGTEPATLGLLALALLVPAFLVWEVAR